MENRFVYRLSIEIIAALLILLFAYAAISKLADFDVFRGQMKAQVLPDFMIKAAVWTLPPTELFTAMFLVFHRTRLTGLWMSLVLMVIFTVYVAIALSGLLGAIPCSCGGIIHTLSWMGHLILNIGFTLLAFTGIVLESNTTKDLR